jgi:hypothetical protein
MRVNFGRCFYRRGPPALTLVKNSRDPDQIIWPGETNRAYRDPVADILREALQIHKANKVSAELHSTNVENWTSVEN